MAQILSKLTILSVVDILAIAVLIYQFALVVRGRHAAHILTGFSVLMLLYLFAIRLHLELLRSALATLAPYSVIAIVVLFQSEIRGILARLGRFRWLGLGGQLERRGVADDIVMAVEQMAQARVGALIVIERDAGLRTFIESGVAMDALVSRDLLYSLFQRGGVMHDGAVIIQGDRIAAAACFLPLTGNPVISLRMGTRHRAAIGVTEEGDALAIVVSEETGQISIAMRGELEHDVTPDRVREVLTQHNLNRRQSDLMREPEMKAVAPMRE